MTPSSFETLASQAPQDEGFGTVYPSREMIHLFADAISGQRRLLRSVRSANCFRCKTKIMQTTLDNGLVHGTKWSPKISARRASIFLGVSHMSAARNRRPHLLHVESFALDFAGFQNLFGEGVQNRLCFEQRPEPLHPPDQPSLTVSNIGELRGKLLLAPMELRPVFQFVDIGGHSPHLMRRLWVLFSAKSSVFDACYAVNRADIHRVMAGKHLASKVRGRSPPHAGAASTRGVIPAEAKRRAGIQNSAVLLDSRLRGNDGRRVRRGIKIAICPDFCLSSNRNPYVVETHTLPAFAAPMAHRLMK